MSVRLFRAAALALSAMLGGCALMQAPSLPSSLTSWIPTIPPPSFDWLLGKSNKPGALPDVKATVDPAIKWQVSIAKSAPGLMPAVAANSVFVAAADGSLARLDAATGKVDWRINAGRRISAGPGSDGKLIAIGTDKGDVVLFDAEGKERWVVQVSSEVIAPPRVTESTVIVFSGDGRIFGLAVADGKTRWVNQRTNPPLTVRNSAGGVLHRGGLFVGTAGGHLLAIDPETGTVGWDVTVATPKGATELERIADVTSLPYADEQDVCAAAYQGRVACFEIVRGGVAWSRDLSSLAGLTGDARNLYVTDDKGAVHALDRSTGASVWKQDLLSKRRIGGPQLIGDYLGVVDVEGYLHLLARDDGRYVGRIATDGSQPTSQPAILGTGIVWQSDRGNVIAATVK